MKKFYTTNSLDYYTSIYEERLNQAQNLALARRIRQAEKEDEAKARTNLIRPVLANIGRRLEQLGQKLQAEPEVHPQSLRSRNPYGLT